MGSSIKIKPKIAVIGLKGLPALGGAATVGESIIYEMKSKYDFVVLSVSSHAFDSHPLIVGYRQVVFTQMGKGGVNTFVYTIKCLIHCLLNKYDLIHLHHASSGFITPFLLLKSKVIVTFHGVHRNNDPKFSKIHNIFFKFSERINVLFANEVVSVSKPDVDFIKKKYKREVIYIPNGIKQSVNQSSEPLSKDYLLFAAARIYQIKGLHLLLRAAGKLNKNLEIIVAGDLDQINSYKKEILELSRNMNVKFVGLVKDKNELLNLVRNAKLFIFPSLTEAMSMMLLEAASVRTPIIASDIPANIAVFNNEELLYFESNNVNDLTEKIEYAIKNESEMKSRANLAYLKLMNEYTWESIAKQYGLIYDSLMT